MPPSPITLDRKISALKRLATVRSAIIRRMSLHPNNLRAARKALGLTQTQMADALRLSEKNGARSIRIWEKDGNTVPGPVQIAVGYMMREHEAKGPSRKQKD